MIWRIVRIGFPALMSGIQRTLSQFLIMYLVVPFGTAAVAGHTINQRVEMILMMPAMAFGMTSGVLMAHTAGYLSPPMGGSLYMPSAMKITFAAQASDPLPMGDTIVNTAELQDQMKKH